MVAVPVASSAEHSPRETFWGKMYGGQERTKRHRIDMPSRLPTSRPSKCWRSIHTIRGTAELTYQRNCTLANGRHRVRDTRDDIGRRGAIHECTDRINGGQEGFQTVEGSRFEGNGDSKGEGMKGGRLERGGDERKGDVGRGSSSVWVR